MSDVHDIKTRSYNMSRIRGNNTKPELSLRKALYAKGYRYRKNMDSLPGKPDIVLSKYGLVINVNGCFWHGHAGCKFFKIPSTRTQWWVEKIEKTKERDTINNEKLQELGWKVITIWECDIKKNIQNVIEEIEAEL